MSEAKSLIAELDAALCKASDSRHWQILRQVTDLLVAAAVHFSDEQIDIFGDVIGRLVEKAEVPALVELSARLAPIANAPADVITRLCRHDNIAVAGPVLEKSSLLADDVLEEIAEAKQQKFLAAIAGRAQIGESVSDILIRRGNSEVAHKLVANLDARISELGFVRLIGQAKNDKTLASAIADRTDLPPELIPFLNLALA
jgi:uncharacterized protein (DUF2336 family)